MCHAYLRAAYEASDSRTPVRRVFEGRVVFTAGEEAEGAGPERSSRRRAHHGPASRARETRRGLGWCSPRMRRIIRANLESGRPFPIVFNSAEMLEGFEIIKRLASSPAHIIPGHDPLVLCALSGRAAGARGHCGAARRRAQRVVHGKAVCVADPRVSSKEILAMTGRVAIVTGSTRGIGLATARRFAEAGARVVISSRKLEACEAVRSELAAAGHEVLAVAAHAARREDLARLVDATLSNFGRLDVVVANAATNPVFDPLTELPEESWVRILNTNLSGPLHLARLRYPTSPLAAGERWCSSRRSTQDSAWREAAPMEYRRRRWSRWLDSWRSNGAAAVSGSTRSRPVRFARI